MKFEIKHRWSGAVLFSLETDRLKLCVEAAVKSGAHLRGADLEAQDLGSADLRGADLRDADLSDADLGDADLSDAYLRGADLRAAYLGSAHLRGADLRGAKLRTQDDQELTCVDNRPLLMLGPLGSRADTLYAWLTDRGVYVRAGCFFDTLEKFAAAVIQTHGDGVHAQEYRAAVAMIEAHARLWKPAAQEDKS